MRIMYYRRLPQFEYLAPKSVEEACSTLQKYGTEARVMAGGTIILHRMKDRVYSPKYLVSLKAIKDLDYITFDRAAGLGIGAMVSLGSIADSAVVKEKYEVLGLVSRTLGTPQIRNMGTIGGNVSAKFATAETVPALIALGAEAKITSAGKERKIPIENLFRELKDEELLTQICVPPPKIGMKGGCEKFAMREKYDYATVSAVVVMTLTKGICQDVRIALGGVTLPTMRANRAEEAIRGKPITDSLIEKTAQIAAEDGKTGADIYFSAEYKKELLKAMVERAMKQALKG
jgi:CO/xanthine dehydrogenase FAD-binding subunit